MGLAVPSNGIFLQMIRSIRNILHLTLYMSYSSEIKLKKIAAQDDSISMTKTKYNCIRYVLFLIFYSGKSLIGEMCQHDNDRSICTYYVIYVPMYLYCMYEQKLHTCSTIFWAIDIENVSVALSNIEILMTHSFWEFFCQSESLTLS